MIGELRRCVSCHGDKDRREFYAQPSRDDGLMPKCKECVKAAVKLHRRVNLEAVRAYDRERSKLPHRIANATRVAREWRRKHRDRQAAHNAMARAQAKGATAPPPEACEGCGATKPLQGHHHDYSRPLLVVWLCKPCHVIADKIRRRLEAS